MIKEVNIKDLKPAEKNPRYIRDENFKKLVKSIKDFPEMLQKRPLVVDEDMTILGGNMRYRACQELKIKKIPVIVAEGWTEEQKNEFLIKDNINVGEWDFDMLANEFEVPELIEWGMDSYSFGTGHLVSDLLGDDEDDEVEESETSETSIPEKAKITDEGFTRFEIIIPEDSKHLVIDIIDHLKSTKDMTSGEAFIHVFKSYRK